MRTNLKSFLARLALIALITLGVNVRLSAHDLPADRSLTENATSNCFTSSPARVAPQSLLAIVPPDVGVAPRPQSKVLASAVSKPQSTMADEVELSSALPQSLLAIAPPDVGVAPRPHSKLLPVAIAKAQPAKAGEVYMPYDFRMSDWRFGQFPYHGKTASAPHPTALPSLADGSPCVPSLALSITAEEAQATPPTRTCEALGELIQQFEQLQSVASTALSSGPALSRSAFSIADSIERFVVASRRALFSGKPSETAASDQLLVGQPASLSNDLVGPQFVVYGSTIGEHVVLTLAQARAWHFEMPLANSRTTDQSRLMKLLGAGLKPIQTSVLATATSGLQSAGHTLLKLSQSLSNISEPRVASGPQANQF